MANDLTGDYDVIAAFSLGAVNRILAAMHRGNRLPHSLSMAVDDFPEFPLGAAVVAIVDKYGDALTDFMRVKRAAYAAAPSNRALDAELIRNVDPVVNWRPDPGGPPAIRLSGFDQAIGAGAAAVLGSQDFSMLSGVAQLQLGPPTMQLPRDRTDRGDVHTPVTIRYIPNPQSRVLSDFMQGEIVTTFGVKPVPAGSKTNIVVDVTASEGNVHFTSSWSAVGLDPGDIAAINKALFKSLKQSFQPSSTPLPPSLKRMDFKGFPIQGAVAVMMNVSSSTGASPNSVGSVPMGAADHFTMSVNGDSITGPFADAVNAAIPRTVSNPDVTFKTKLDVGLFQVTVVNCTVHSRVDLGTATVTLFPDFHAGPIFIPGRILLSIPAHVSIWWDNKPSVVHIPSAFDLTLTQSFILTLSGREVGIQTLGGADVAFSGDTAVTIAGATIIDLQAEAKSKITAQFNAAWSANSGAIQTKINQALSADRLQDFLRSLMNPAPAKSAASAAARIFGQATSSDSPPQEVDPDLEYTSVEIRPSGIVLHGSLAVPPWPAPHVEFDKDPWESHKQPEYRALKSWIPGGTIQQFQWHFPTSTLTDSHRFVTINAPSLTLTDTTICLVISGSRITASGPVSYESVVSSRVCKMMSMPLGRIGIANLDAGNRPRVIVPKPRPDPEGPVEAAAHVSPWAAEGSSGGTANFVVYFPDNQSLRQLEFLTGALSQSGRTDTETAIVCVLTPEQLSSVRAANGLLYADDAAAWERLLGIRSRPSIAILSPAGEVVWRQDGEIGGGLAEAFRVHLAPGGQFFPRFVESPLRVGEPSPNFIFEAAPGEKLTLRKVAGRPAALVFFRSSSAPAVQAIGNLRRAYSQPGIEETLIIAIDDGEAGEFARGLTAGDERDIVVVPDPERQISRAYGVDVWPTIVFLDSDGLVQDVRFGLIAETELQTRLQNKAAEPNQPGKTS